MSTHFVSQKKRKGLGSFSYWVGKS